MTMKIELRKVHHSKSLSEETNAYTAEIWIDGKHFCDVSNHGQGGPDQHTAPRSLGHPGGWAIFHERLKEVEKRIAAEWPKIDCTTFGGKGTMDHSLETVCGDLLAAMAIEKDLKRLLKRTVAFVDPKGGVRSYKGKHEGVQRARLCTETLRKYPGAVILNNLPFDEALALYRKEAA